MCLSCLGELCVEVRSLDLLPRVTGSSGRVLRRGHVWISVWLHGRGGRGGMLAGRLAS